MNDSAPRLDASNPQDSTDEQAPGASGATPAVAGAESATPSPARRRHKRRRARRVRAADPAARAAAASAALAEVEPLDDEQVAGPAVEGDPAAAEPEAVDPAVLAAASAPVLRVGLKLLALGLRARFPGGAAALYSTAPERAAALSETLGVRIAGYLGALLPLAAIVAEFSEPFLGDKWAAGAAAVEITSTTPGGNR